MARIHDRISHDGRSNDDDWHFTGASMRVGIFIVLWRKILLGHLNDLRDLLMDLMDLWRYERLKREISVAK